MCDPVTMTILAVTTTAASIYANNKSVDAQDAAVRDQLQNLESESRVTETAEVNDNLRAMRKEQARTRVAAGEAGLQLGGSIETLLKDSLTQATLGNDNITLNAERDRQAARANANSRLSSLQKDGVLGAGLKLANAGVQGYVSGSNIQINRQRNATTAGRS